jgi:long-chain fatty acid transport protein
MAKHRPVVHQYLRTCGIAGLLALGSSSTFASSFALIEQSVSGMGTAYAIGSSGINDASTVFFNPAGMARLHGSNVSGGMHIVNSNTDFKGSAEYQEDIPLVGGAPIEGKNNDDIGLTAVIPSGYISHQYSDKLWLGLGVNVPFGLETDYSKNWVGRYQAVKSELLTININPSMAFRFNDNVSIGIGVSALYADGELTNAVDVGLGDFAAAGAEMRPPNLPWYPNAVGTNTYDSKVKMTADDWGYGFNAGLLLEPTQHTRIGLHYRSEIDLTLEGHAKVSGPVANSKQKAKLDLTLPDSVSLSGYYSLNTHWSFMADVTWTQWSDIDTLDIKLQDGSRSVAEWDYDDSFRYSLGTEYTPNRKWTFRTGVALDETPIPSDNKRSPRVPGNDRTWLALGFTYRYTPNLSFDFGYAHLFVDDPKLKGVSDNYDPSAGQTTGAHRLSGKYDSKVDILSAQVNWKFR